MHFAVWLRSLSLSLLASHDPETLIDKTRLWHFSVLTFIGVKARGKILVKFINVKSLTKLQKVSHEILP